MTASTHDLGDTREAVRVLCTTGFAVRAHWTRQRTVLRAYGDLDLIGAPVLRQAGHDVLARSESVHLDLELDLGLVRFLDCAGLGVLIELRNTAVQVGGRPPRITASRAVRRVIDLTGLDDLFEIDPIEPPATRES